MAHVGNVKHVACRRVSTGFSLKCLGFAAARPDDFRIARAAD
jgi:hypothetical protein